MSDCNRINGRDLDNYITGHYGEDQYPDEPEEEYPDDPEGPEELASLEAARVTFQLTGPPLQAVPPLLGFHTDYSFPLRDIVVVRKRETPRRCFP